MFLTFTNLSNRTLTVFHRTDRAFVSAVPPIPIVPPVPMTPIYPPNPCVLPPRTAAAIQVPLFLPLTTAEGDASTQQQATGNQQVLVVTVSGDIHRKGDLMQVKISGGYSPDGTFLQESETEMFVLHENFKLVSEHNSDLNDEDESSDEESSSSKGGIYKKDFQDELQKLELDNYQIIEDSEESSSSSSSSSSESFRCGGGNRCGGLIPPQGFENE